MDKIIHNISKTALHFKALGLLLVFGLFCPHSVFSQNSIPKIVRLNHLSDSLVRIDGAAAKKAAEEALDLSLKLSNDSLEYASRFRRAIANYFTGNLNLALEDFIKNKTIAERLKHSLKTIESLNAIGNVYKDLEQNELALKTYQEAKDVCLKTNNSGRFYLVESNIAIVLGQLKQYDSSNVHCYHILSLMQRYKKTDKEFASSIYNILLTNYIDKKNKDSVNKYAVLTLSLQKQAGDKLSYAGALYNLATFYYKMKDFPTAKKYLLEASSENPNNIELRMEIKKALGDTEYELKNFKQSAYSYWEAIGCKDSIYQIQTVDKISEMEVKYETGKKEEELKRMSAEKEITDLKAKQSKIWLIVASIGILFVVIVAVVLFKQNKNRQQANKLLQHQNDEIVHQKKEITDSINYAKRIQLAILPPDKMVKKLLPTAFVMYKPKDVVSGDFYWMEEKNGIVMFAAVDCTGHGVPGAMMSVVGLNLLNQAVKEKGLTTPSEILKHLDTGVTDTLRQSGDTDSIKDGMDLSLCSYNPKTLELQYAGAFNNLWVVRNNISSSYKLQNKFEVFFEEHLLEIKADKFPIGSNLDGVADNYNNHTLQLQKGDCVYLYSDGYADQFGGPKGKKYKYNSLKKLLVSIHELPPDEQREKLLSSFESWRGNLEQIDDILVMGVCV